MTNETKFPYSEIRDEGDRVDRLHCHLRVATPLRYESRKHQKEHVAEATEGVR